jgi:diaminopimelate decarboxylase
VGQGVLSAEVFPRVDGQLHVEGVPLAAIAREVGTPAYVYSAAHLRARAAALQAALHGVPHGIHYSMKANGCRAVLRTLHAAGCGIDVVSGGELYKALAAGVPASDIVFGGVGKTRSEIAEALRAGVRVLNGESRAEIALAAAIAAEQGLVLDIGLRVNPEVEVTAAHAYIETGEEGHKFGIPQGEVPAAVAEALALPALRLRAIVMHVGSQMSTLTAVRAGAERLVAMVLAAREAGARDLDLLDLGGGLAVRYDDEPEADLAALRDIAQRAHAATGCTILIEPGRYLVANAGLLLTRVLYRKTSGDSEIVIVDAGMTELVRPALYEAYHRIEAVGPVAGTITGDLVGPVCESGDFLALARALPDLRPGDLVAVHSVGAYGSAMASTYNARPRAAEVLVDGERWALATARESYADLVRLDRETLDWRTA